jgi:dihydroxyacetone kinase-like predicted kinase
VDELISDVERAAGDAADFEITRAIRDAEIGGLEIREGDYIAISSGKIVAVSGTPEDAVLDALETADADLCEILTVFAGKDVPLERKAALQSALEDQYEDLEIVMLDGGQETYDYYAALE